ncbi:hypothetical protein EDM53_01755 [Rickettsiales endosymbiont of Peranema trichophorum]|uniref:diacylglycerol/polyprenol kinase family protein n=1 Tax=Rickettsiales endosymbiont of Peranema trichophorum TaxID=2486577 RepID=UPI001022C42B|nr:hypothetical protein [Rickettsiales endosymbiont of Peranema trichophorum]RZI47456.1 hypothetical protein EDM53_01755 [Rickettsiales endosymbiont of Peranema trichophorum]
MQIQLKHEFCRKLIHLSSLWIPILYYYVSYATMFRITSLIAFSLVAFDLLKNNTSVVGPKVRVMLQSLYLYSLFRPHEQKHFSGATYMLLSAVLCLELFEKSIFIMSFLVVIISDTASSIVGMSFGKTKILGNKTYVGTAAFLGCSVMIVLLSSFHISNIDAMFIGKGVVAAASATLIELFSKKIGIDDNIAIPVTFGGTLTLML